MNILYISNARIPTEKAHGVAIMKACESFVRAGAGIRMVVARRRNALLANTHEFYGVRNPFPIVRMATIDAYGFLPDRISFYLQALTFYLSLFGWMLFQSRKPIIYTRDAPVAFFSFLGFRVVYECHHLSGWKRTFFFLCRRARRIITISSALKDAFVAVGFDEKRILVAPSGVDLDIFDILISKKDARIRLNLPEKEFIALYTGNFTTFGKDKGIADSIRAITLLDSNMIFLAVGGSESDIERYKILAREQGVADKVILIGHLPQSELAIYQKSADVLMMPFPDLPHYRNHMSPVKMFEYMASNRPIIASDLPTIREVLNEQNAVLVAPGSPAQIAQAMDALLVDTTRGDDIAREARMDVNRYTWTARARLILDTIGQCL